MKARTERSKTILVILMLLAVIGLCLLLWRPAAADYNLPADAWGYPAPVGDPWCEELMLLELPTPIWCPVIGEAITTAAIEPEATATPAPAVVKIGGRMKKGGR